ncbi:MAG: hypothetical protein AAFV53_25400, partial [Myxococcota bacterium]
NDVLPPLPDGSDDDRDDWQFKFFYPRAKKLDALPGWFQKYTIEDISIEPGDSFTIEWENYGCKSCSAAAPDMVLEYRVSDRSTGALIDADSWVFGEPQAGSNESKYPSRVDSTGNEFFLPKPAQTEMPEFESGRYDVEIIMYSISNPSNWRGAYVRLVNTADEFNIVNSRTPVFESGLLGADPSLTAFPFETPYDTFNAAQRAGAWIESAQMQQCFSSVLTNQTSWQEQCEW